MTEAGMKKYVGKKVRIKMNIFPHSVKTEEIVGVVSDPVETTVNTLRGTTLIHKTHLDFYVGKKLIEWNKLKLIRSIEVIEDVKRN